MYLKKEKIIHLDATSISKKRNTQETNEPNRVY